MVTPISESPTLLELLALCCTQGWRLELVTLSTRLDIRALVIRTGFGSPLNYNHNKEPPNSLGSY